MSDSNITTTFSLWISSKKRNNKLQAKTYKIHGNRKIWLNSCLDFMMNLRITKMSGTKHNNSIVFGIYLVMVKTMQEPFILYNTLLTGRRKNKNTKIR